MRPDVLVEFKQLRLYGMIGAWSELVIGVSRWTRRNGCSSTWSEHADRAMRSVRQQLTLARFPPHRDLADFDFDGTPIVGTDSPGVEISGEPFPAIGLRLAHRSAGAMLEFTSFTNRRRGMLRFHPPFGALSR